MRNFRNHIIRDVRLSGLGRYIDDGSRTRDFDDFGGGANFQGEVNCGR